MAESSGSSNRAIQQQASAMVTSVASHENVVRFLRSLEIPPDDEDQAKQLADTIDSVQKARADLIKHFDFLGVAFDYGWDAAKIFKEDSCDATDKRIISAVNKAKKKREADEKENKKKRSSSSSSSYYNKKPRSGRSDHSSSSSSASNNQQVQHVCHSATSSSSCCPQSHQQPYQPLSLIHI